MLDYIDQMFNRFGALQEVVEANFESLLTQTNMFASNIKSAIGDAATPVMETLSGVMQRLNNDMQAGKFQPFINTMVNGMSMIGNGIAWVVENLNWIAPVLAGVITALVMFGQYGLGLAPIGHTVTVKTSTDLAVNVTGSIKLRPGESFDVVKELVEDAVSEYIGGIGFTEETVYYAKLVANMLGASTAIRDVQNVTINGQSANIDLVKTFTNYQVPILGTITLSEVEAP